MDTATNQPQSQPYRALITLKENEVVQTNATPLSSIAYALHKKKSAEDPNYGYEDAKAELAIALGLSPEEITADPMQSNTLFATTQRAVLTAALLEALVDTDTINIDTLWQEVALNPTASLSQILGVEIETQLQNALANLEQNILTALATADSAQARANLQKELQTNVNQLKAKIQSGEPYVIGSLMSVEATPTPEPEPTPEPTPTPEPEPTPTTYSWSTSTWDTCTGDCGTNNATQARTVTCTASTGGSVADGMCSGTKPATTQACTASACAVVGTSPVMGDIPNQYLTLNVAMDDLNTSAYVTLTEDDLITTYTLLGTLPAGTSFDSSTGVIRGTPTEVGAFNFTISVTDKDGESNVDSFQIAIEAFSINNDATNTNSTLIALNGLADYNYIAEWYATESPNLPDITAEGWVSTKPTSLNISTGDGEKTVYVYVKNSSDTVALLVSDTIILDTLAPTITSTNPTNSATGVDVYGWIDITFSKEMDVTTLTTSNITLNNSKSCQAIDYNTTLKRARCIVYDGQKSDKLNDNTAYTLTVSTDVKDTAGITLQAPYTLGFSTTAQNNLSSLKTGQTTSYVDHDDAWHATTGNLGESRSFSRENGIVTDATTGLMWQDNVVPSSTTFEDANTTCQNLILSGHGEWRVPTLAELASITDKSEAGAIDATFVNTVAAPYYSTDTAANDEIWAIDFSSGKSVLVTSSTHYVRCVR